MRVKKLLSVFFLLMQTYAVPAQELPSLSKIFATKFKFGFGGLNDQIVRKGLVEPNSPIFNIVKSQSNILSVNCFYPNQVHQNQVEYKWDQCTPLMDFANQFPDKVLRGHALLWPANAKNNLEWLLVDANGSRVDRDEAIKRLRTHIQTIVTHYKGRFRYWDVLNEAVDPNASDGIRAGLWKEIIGPQYVEIAFEAARKADPNAKLFYNDFNEWKPQKREAIFSLVKKLKSKGLIDGIGMQQHVNLFEPSASELNKTISRFAELGVEIHVTELDVETNRNGQYLELTPELNQKLAKRYKELFDIYLKHAGQITAVMTFNVTDASSWLRHHPSPHATWPLLFDAQGQAKPAFWALAKR
jgi:endo-1,4-beta-xylanase